MYFEDIQKIVDIYSKRYTDPEIWWSKLKFKKRCIEQWICEDIIKKCYDNPFINPYDIIYNKTLELYMYINLKEKDIDNLMNVIGPNGVRQWNHIFKLKNRIIEYGYMIDVLKYLTNICYEGGSI